MESDIDLLDKFKEVLIEEPLVTKEIREMHFNATGEYATDLNIWAWYKAQD